MEVVRHEDDGPPRCKKLFDLSNAAALKVLVAHCKDFVDEKDVGVSMGGDGEAEVGQPAGLAGDPMHHTGVALAATEKLVRRGEIRPGDRVVVVSTAHGLKFVDFKLRYHEMELEGIVPEHANPPVELPADYQTVSDELHRQIDARFGGR